MLAGLRSLFCASIETSLSSLSLRSPLPPLLSQYQAALSCICRHQPDPGQFPAVYPTQGLAVYRNGGPALSQALLGPAAQGCLESVNVHATKHVMQGGHARGTLPAEPQRLGKLGVLPAPLGDGIQAPGAAEHGAYRQGQNCRQGMAHSLGLPGVLYLTQGIQQSGSPIPNTLLPHNNPPHSLNSDPIIQYSPQSFQQLKDPDWYKCECCAKFRQLPEPLAEGVSVYTVCGCPASKRRLMIENPACRLCGQKLEFLGEDCQCPEATERRKQDAADKQSAQDLDRENREAIAQRERDRQAAAVVDAPAHLLRTPTQRKKQELKDRELTVQEKELADRERRLAEGQQARQDKMDAIRAGGDDVPVVALTLADFTQEVTLLDLPDLPSALTRSDGATLIYQGRFNTLYGETGMGKTWIAIMAAIQQQRAGGRVL